MRLLLEQLQVLLRVVCASSFFFLSERMRLFPYLHRLCYCINRERVMRNLFHFIPLESGRVFDRLLQLGLRITIGNYIKPVTVPAVFSNTALIWCKQNLSCRTADAFNFYESEFAGIQVKTGNIVAEVLFMDIEDLAILGLFILKDSLHGKLLDFKIGSQTPDFRSFLFWVRKYENACHPFHCLQGKRFLALKLLTSFFTAVEDFCMTRLCLRKTSF